MLCIDYGMYIEVENCNYLPIVLLQAAAAGPQTDTARFACWEEHTRGMGSKLMAAMGFRQGQGLGPNSAGAAAPIEVLWLPTHLLSHSMSMLRYESRAASGCWQDYELGGKGTAVFPDECYP